MSKDIVVQLTKPANGFPKGAEFGFVDEATAAETLGEDSFEVVRYQDGSAYGDPVAEEEDHPPSLSKLTRDELDALATEAGVEGAKDLPNKDAVIAAIEEAQG